MGRKLKKAAAALLVAAMFLQQCNVVSIAESDPTEMSAEAEAAAAAEAEAQAAAEAAAQSEAEAAAQSEAEAAAQAAAEAAAQSEAEAAAQAAAEAAAQSEAEAAAQAAAEAAAQSEAEAAAQAAAEAAAQSEAEAATQSEAEAALQSEAEAAAQAAAEAAAQSEAEAAAQSEAEAAAQAAAEAAAQSEAEAAAQAAAEAAAQAAAEAETAEAETEQPARSSRVNAGAQIGKDDLTAMLENILPYLFVAETVTFPEMQEEDAEEAENLPAPESWILEGDAAGTELASQAWNSLTLADAQSSEEVTVINLYFDEFGTLDITQLYNIFEDQILDVTNGQYYVVNVIADSPEQVLDFTGLDISENGLNLYYTESTQPCSVLYNFAAMDGDAFTDYRGTLNLWGTLQGAVLAPSANVVVEQNLAGAVYAQNITVASPEAQLQRNIYIEGEPEATETEAAEPEPEVIEEPIPETEAPAPETEAETEVATEAPETEPETEAVTEAPAPETEAETETVTETPETEAVTEAPETEPETEVLTEEVETETETETSETEQISVPATLQITPEDEGISTFSVENFEITAQAVYEGEVLTAIEEQEYQIGLFAENDAKDDSVAIYMQTLTIKKEESKSTITFDKLESGKYYIYEVDDDGYQIDSKDFEIEENPIEINDGETGQTIQLIFTSLPEGYKGEYTLNITAQAVYEGEVLTAVKDQEYKLGVFAEKDDSVAIDVQTLTIDKGNSEGQVTFEDLVHGEYYIYEVDDKGNKDERFDIQPIKIEETNAVNIDDVKTVEESLQLEFKDYPDGEFSYDVTVSVKLKVLGHDGETLKTDETFYAMIYEDEDLSHEVFDEPIEFVMNREASQTEEVTIISTKEKQPIFIVETDKDGNLINSDEFAYIPTYKKASDDEKYGEIEIKCGKDDFSETITNTLKDTIIYISIVNKSGKLLDGASYVILNSSFQPVTGICSISDSKADKYENTKKDKSELKDGEKYYVYQIDAPEGYTPSPYVEFKVEAGFTNEVIVEDEKVEETGSSITATKSVYVGDYAVYATSEHTFYLALFKDEEHKEKVSNVKELTVRGYTGAITFDNLKLGDTYYIAETDNFGIAVPSKDSELEISYSPEQGKVTIEKNVNHQVQVKNTYSYLKNGYRYYSELKITKNVADADGAAKNVSDTFYIGLFENSDYSDDSPKIYSLRCNNKSTAEIGLLVDVTDSDKTYYLAELRKDEDDKYYVITDESDFSYKPSISASSVTLSKGKDQSVTVTNTEKSEPMTSVELYLTKRVYYGEDPYEVNDTFYVGLFKDEELTTLYTTPIPMPMADKEDGELTQKITMSVSESKDTSIYVAEVHEDGTPVTESQYQSFGYEIGSEQPIEVLFGPTRATAQRAVILNGVYGTMTDEDWDDIYNDIDDLYGDDDEIELADYLEEETVQTGDDTPVAGTLALMAAALIVLGYSIRRRRRAS